MPEISEFNQILSLISFGISIFLTSLLFISPKEKSASRILSFIMGLYSGLYLIRYGLSVESGLVIYFPFVSIPLMFLYGPLVFFYTRTSLFQTRIQKKEIINTAILPFFGFLIYLFLFTQFPEFRDPKIVFLQKDKVGIFTSWMLFLGITHPLIFLYFSRNLIRKYQSEFEENYASDAIARLSWLKGFLVFNFLMVLAYFLIFILQVLGLWKLPLSPFEGIINILLMYQILYYLINKPAVFQLNEEREMKHPEERKLELISPTTELQKSELVPSNLTIATKYSKQNLAEDERKAYLSKIQKFMQEEKPYLDDELSLNELAGRLKIPIHHFSMTINIELGKNFFHFVSSYRVQEAKRILSDPKSKELTILSIAFESGFQSKAAFNKAFKEETGFTPTEYRNKF